MGLFDSLRGGGDPDPDDGPDAYRVVRKTEKGGWSPVDEFDELDEPIDKQTFEYNAEPLRPGEYRLFAIQNNMNKQPPEGTGWVLQVEGGTGRDDSQDDEIGELKREIRRMREESASDDQEVEDIDPSMAVERQKASIQLAALNSEQFMRKHGEKIALAMFDDGAGSGGGSSIGYDDWQQNPVGASLFETFKMVRDEPEQIERLGEAIGRGAGSFMGAAADGFAEDGQTLAEAKEQAGEQESTQEPDPEPQREIDAGPSTMDDLGGGDGGAVDTETLTEDIANARMARKAGPGEQDVPDADDTAADSTPPAGAESDRPDGRDEHPTDALTDDDAAAAEPDPDTEPDEPMTTDTPTPESSDGDNNAREIAGDL